jgi:RNA polymerase sigma factor (sigma-70 family)
MAPSPLFASDDARILDRIRKGDEGALADLYRENRKPVRALVTRNSGSEDDADDMLQEALVTLWDRVATGRFRYSARLGTFIYATAQNMWLRRLARARREIPGIATDPPADDASPLDLMIEDEESEIIRSALERLGEPCRKLLLLFYWEEESMESIAAQMGMANADTVKSRKYQCKKSLEALIRERSPRHG